MTREQLFETYPGEKFMFADGYDDAIVGVEPRTMRLIYDQKKVVASLMKDGMSWEEALDFFMFNIECAYVGEQTPIWCDTGEDLQMQDT